MAAWGWVENGKCLFAVSFRDDENVLEWGGGGGDGCTVLWVY